MIVAVIALGALSGGFSGGNPTPTASGPLPAVTEPAPPNATAQLAHCTTVIEKLPVQLGTLDPRAVHTTPTDTTVVIAWGQPAVVFSCGVAKPKTLFPGSGVEFREVDGLPFDLQLTKTAAIYTTVDRAPYISVTFPAGVQPATYLPMLIAPITALPPVCSTDNTIPDPGKLCTRRTS